MTRSSHRVPSSLGLAGAVIVSGAAVAGFESSLGFSEMVGGGGYVDVDSPFTGSTEFVIVENPVPGSFIDVTFGQPASGVFGSDTVFGSFNSGVALFNFQHYLVVEDFTSNPDLDFAFAGSRLTFTTTLPVEVTLIASVGGSLTGFGFLEVYGDGDPDGELFVSEDNPVVFQFTLAAGTYDLGWGAGVIPIGGTATFNGSLAIQVIPAPGSLALLAAAVVATRRRRR